MIIGSYRPLTVGAVHREGGITDNDAQTHWGMPCRVLRQATMAEWIAEARAEGIAPERIAYMRMVAAVTPCHFYEVAVD